LREENITSFPALAQTPPSALPTCPEPMMPIFSFWLSAALTMGAVIGRTLRAAAAAVTLSICLRLKSAVPCIFFT